MSDENALDAHIRLSVLKARYRVTKDEADTPVTVEREPKIIDVYTFMELLEKESPTVEEEEKPPKRRYVVTPYRKPDWMKNRKLLPMKPPTQSGRPWEPDR